MYAELIMQRCVGGIFLRNTLKLQVTNLELKRQEESLAEV